MDNPGLLHAQTTSASSYVEFSNRLMNSFLSAALIAATLALPVPGHGADEIRFDVAVLPEFQKYSALFDHPGYAAIVLENNGLSPSAGSKITVKERGRSLEARNGILRFDARKGDRYTFECGVVLSAAGIETRLTFPIIIDVSTMGSGKITVVLKPPLAALLPEDFNVRLRRKVAMVTATAAQAKVLAYLDDIAKGSSGAPELTAMMERVFLDSYNSSGGPGPGGGNQPDQQGLLTSDQWILVATFVIWLSLVSVLFAVYLLRQRRGTPARSR